MYPAASLINLKDRLYGTTRATYSTVMASIGNPGQFLANRHLRGMPDIFAGQQAWVRILDGFSAQPRIFANTYR